MSILRAAFWAALLLGFFPPAAYPQDVTLTSRDGSVEIVGTLLGYDGEFFRVNSIYGVLTVDGSGVNCAGPGCPDLDAFIANINFSGARTLGQKLLPALLDAFSEQHDYIVTRLPVDETNFSYVFRDVETGQEAARFDIRLSNSDEGFADLLTDDADIAMSLREVLLDEVSRGVDAGLGRLSSPGQNRVVALDGLVPVVSIGNPVQQISPEDLAQVFSGEISNWQDLNGIDAPITLHLRASGSGSLHVFLERIMYPSERILDANIQRYTSNSAMLTAVATDPFAIGLSTLSDIGNTRALNLVSGCGFRSGATPEALKSDDYPLTAPVFFYLKSRRLPAIGREFMRFVQSPAAQIAILRAGYVDQSIARTPIGRQGNRLANAIRSAGEEVNLDELKRLVSVMDLSRRLSVTFRFSDGSSELNAQSRSNIVLLARALETGLLGSKELIFVGFSDGDGSAEANKRLSRRRAVSVRAAVLKEAATIDPNRIKLSTEGFGEAMPMACDDTEWGRQINRRVEVWAK